MSAKSDDLRRSLCEIDHLLHTLRANGVGDAIDLDEVDLLEGSRRSIVNLLEARRRQNSSTSVSLQAWHSGDLSALPLTTERLASMAQVTHPQHGKPRLHCVS